MHGQYAALRVQQNRHANSCSGDKGRDDVSGDGMDNCNGRETTDVIRDELVAYGAVINGLPIIEHTDCRCSAAFPDTSRSDDLNRGIEMM